MARIPARDAGPAVAARQDFTSSSALTARHEYPSYGRLPDAERAVLRDVAQEHGSQTYVVYSYGTPAAWAAPGGPLYIPDVKYSVTTSKHQSYIRRAA